MFDDMNHPLFGRETSCHKCSGVAVWVFNGDMVGNYHYCRDCKVETGPFAKDIQPSLLPADVTYTDLSNDIIFFNYAPLKKRKGFVPTAIQVDTQAQMEDRMDQLLFEFMKPQQ